MSPAERSPFAVSREDRRRVLSRHFVPVVENLAGQQMAFAAMSVEKICSAGGVSRSAFYKYFDDKTDLLVAMAGGVIDELLHSGEVWWSMPDSGDKAELKAALSVPLRTYLNHRVLFGAVVEVASYDERVRALQRHLVTQVNQSLASHLKDAQAEGSAYAGIDAQHAATWIVWMLERGLYQEVTDAGEGDGEALLDALTEIVWRVFYAGHRRD